MKKKTLYALPAILWSIGIIALTLQSADVSADLSGGIVSYVYTFIETLNIPITFDNFHFIVRKIAHFSEYFVLGILLFVALRPYTFKSSVQIVMVFLIGVIFASVDESIQLFVDGRHGSVVDVLIDSMGILFSIGCYIIVSRIRREESV